MNPVDMRPPATSAAMNNSIAGPAADPLPFVYPRSAVPHPRHPDCTEVGSVVATIGAIVPATVGVDIGCGTTVQRTQFTRKAIRRNGKPLRALADQMEMAVPKWPAAGTRELPETARRRLVDLDNLAATIGFDPDEATPDWRRDYGTLGGGTHFVRVEVDQTDNVWLAVHAGSRTAGQAVARRHIEVADELSQHFINENPDPATSYLIEGTDTFAAYVGQSLWAQAFARANREEMMDRAIACLNSFVLGPGHSSDQTAGGIRISSDHNFVRKELHFGRSVWVSRRGAIDARHGIMGVAPASTGPALFVVEGNGDHAALCSLPHGRYRPSSVAGGCHTSVLTGSTGIVTVRHVLQPLLDHVESVC